MNQDLKQKLIEQAGFHFRPSIENTVPGIEWSCASYGYDQCIDKLIELVAKECIVQIQISTARDPQDTPQYKQSVGHQRKIKEHFGMEK